MERKLFSEEHELFRKSFRTFVEREVVPNQPKWNAQGSVDRAAWKQAGEGGFLCPGSRRSTAAARTSFTPWW